VWGGGQSRGFGTYYPEPSPHLEASYLKFLPKYRVPGGPDWNIFGLTGTFLVFQSGSRVTEEEDREFARGAPLGEARRRPAPDESRSTTGAYKGRSP
jgi:hypothetical protein